MITRRSLLGSAVSGIASGWLAKGSLATDAPRGQVELSTVGETENVFEYIQRRAGPFDPALYRQILGAANEFKEGDAIVGVAALDEQSRSRARQLLYHTRVRDLDKHPLLKDQLHTLIIQNTSREAARLSQHLTLGELKEHLLASSPVTVSELMPGLSSDVIGCLVKIMSNADLIELGSRVFNPLPGSNIGAKGYMGARIQPNSPTDNVDDIRWQVFNGWAFAVGDVVLGTNPVSSDPRSVLAVELVLEEILETFAIEHLQPHCVLSHIDVQAEVEQLSPGSTQLWFQSIAGSDSANATFDVTIEKMLRYASQRTGRYGLYFETGQGADFTNGHSHGFDMVLHESRKYGFARALANSVASVSKQTADQQRAWVHVNDVAGFIGPEVFRTREQLVRCCLEDIVMGKLHGLCIGLDVCSTLHMDVSLEDLDWCLDQVMPANPAYLMALPTKIDPMLGYLTTSFQDHVRLRHKFNYRVNDGMWEFFKSLGIINADGTPTNHFGDPLWVYMQYRRRLGDSRSDEELLQIGQQEMDAARRRGVFLARGYGSQPWIMNTPLAAEVTQIYEDAKLCIWKQLEREFVERFQSSVFLETRSQDRTDYILHPETGEQLSPGSAATVEELKSSRPHDYNVQIVISDGLNALSIMEAGQLETFLRELQRLLASSGYSLAPEHLFIKSGRVRAGYRVGEALFAKMPGKRAILHIIGERPGTGHHTFSVYMTAPDGSVWGEAGEVDHNITKVVSGIAITALAPIAAAAECVRILDTM